MNSAVKASLSKKMHCYSKIREWQGWLVLLSFSWPLVILSARWKSRKIGKLQMTQWLEILLCLGSGYIFWTISSFGERLFGAYIALSGLALYLIAAARDTIQSAVRKRHTRQNSQQL